MEDRFKFRAWDRKAKKMLSWDYLIKARPCLGEFFYDDNLLKLPCTGLKDKNGKLIYEGDILEFDGYPCVDASDDCDLNHEFIPSGKGINYRYVVEWFGEDASWSASIRQVSNRVSGRACGYSLGEFIEFENPVIVGNKYEKPQLLQFN